MLLLSVFTPIYESLAGSNPNMPEYREGIFSSVGMFTIIVSAVMALVFYIGLGRWKPIFHKVIHWVIMLAATGIIGFVIAYGLTGKETGTVDGYAMRFALINVFYAVLYYSILSLLLKRASIFARHTPF